MIANLNVIMLRTTSFRCKTAALEQEILDLYVQRVVQFKVTESSYLSLFVKWMTWHISIA